MIIKALLFWSVSMLLATPIVLAQERLPQHSGFGTGVGENAGTGTRSQIWDTQSFLDRLSQPETIYGRVLSIDMPAGKIHLETGGSSHDEGRAGQGSISELIAFLDERTNMESLKMIQTGDDVTMQVVEETSPKQPYGTGRKLLRDISVMRGNEHLAAFGGVGQRPDPRTERGIITDNASINAGMIGQVMPGEIKLGIHSDIGEITGAAPCWQCEPQPGWGYESKSNKSDYGTSEKPIMEKH
jgi:hypothetical protein